MRAGFLIGMIESSYHDTVVIILCLCPPEICNVVQSLIAKSALFPETAESRMLQLTLPVSKHEKPPLGCAIVDPSLRS